MNHDHENRESSSVLRHLQDLCRKADTVGQWQYSGFLTPAEQQEMIRFGRNSGLAFSFDGGYPGAERRILLAGREDLMGYPPEPPLAALRVQPLSEKYAEDLTHPDYLGAILGLGIERPLIGDILIQEKEAWFFCLESIADFLCSSLIQVRRTSVTVSRAGEDHPVPEPRFQELLLHTASERLDAVVAEFTGISRSKVAGLFSGGKVFVNSLPAADPGKKIREGDIFSVRGYGKAVYDGVDRETRKGRLVLKLRKYM